MWFRREVIWVWVGGLLINIVDYLSPSESLQSFFLFFFRAFIGFSSGLFFNFYFFYICVDGVWVLWCGYAYDFRGAP